MSSLLYPLTTATYDTPSQNEHYPPDSWNVKRIFILSSLNIEYMPTIPWARCLQYIYTFSQPLSIWPWAWYASWVHGSDDTGSTDLSCKENYLFSIISLTINYQSNKVLHHTVTQVFAPLKLMIWILFACSLWIQIVILKAKVVTLQF